MPLENSEAPSPGRPDRDDEVSHRLCDEGWQRPTPSSRDDKPKNNDPPPEQPKPGTPHSYVSVGPGTVRYQGEPLEQTKTRVGVGKPGHVVPTFKMN